MTFEGEGGIDAGGLFRDSLREICEELQCQGALRLLLPCPNQRLTAAAAAAGAPGKWLVNPACADLDMYRFLGSLLGASMLRETSLELDLPALVWKPLLGQQPDFADLAATDELFCKRVVELRAMDEATWAAAGPRWVVATGSGQRAELKAGGAGQPVALVDRERYLDACVDYRLREGEAQVAAMREGFRGLVPSVGAAFADWREAERLACGTPVIDVEALRRIATYCNMPGEAQHPVAVRFWEAMEEMSNEERAQVVAFSWGRRRLPPQVRMPPYAASPRCGPRPSPSPLQPRIGRGRPLSF
jgi:hypothetical protein